MFTCFVQFGHGSPRGLFSGVAQHVVSSNYIGLGLLWLLGISRDWEYMIFCFHCCGFKLGILDYSFFHFRLICILGDCGIFFSRNVFALTISCPF